MNAELPACTLVELSSKLARGETTSRAIVDACLERIAALDHRLHAFVEVYADTARACAEAADLERHSGLAHQPDRAQDHLRTGEPRPRGAAFDHARFDRPARPQRGRRRAAHGGDGRS